MAKSKKQTNSASEQIGGSLGIVLKSLEDNMAANTKELVDIHKCMDKLSQRVHENADIIEKHSNVLARAYKFVTSLLWIIAASVVGHLITAIINLI